MLLLALLAAPMAAARGDEPKLRILLLGDSTTIGSICRQVDPGGPQLEDVIRALLAAEPDMPPVEVVNQGVDGERIHDLLTSGRYDRDILSRGLFDYIFIRYGLNDIARREDFEVNFPRDYAELIGRLRRNFPAAEIVPTTVIPFLGPDRDEAINRLVRRAAEAEHLPVFDVYSRYAAELKHGPDMLNYRRYALEKIPERHRAWVAPFVRDGKVVVMDNRLDAHFRDLPGWFSDRHPNPAGYHVIGDETAKFLAQSIRRKKAAAAAPAPAPAPAPASAAGGRAGLAATGLEYIDTAFENASPLWYEAAPDGTILVHLLYDHERSSPNRAAGHIHFRLVAKPGTALTLEFRNLDNVWNGKPASIADELGVVVLSPDGKAWTPAPLERLPGNRVRLAVTMPGPSLYLARAEPYRLSDLEAWLASIAKDPLVEIAPIGRTAEGRSLEIVRVGRPDAPYRVFLRARAHPWEPGGNWVVQGLVERLLRDDDEARRCLARFCVYVLPMANKDGVARGRTRFNSRGKDLNRDWDHPADPELAPENHALEAWLEAMISRGRRPHLAIELHNDGRGLLHVSRPPVPDLDLRVDRIKTLESLLRKHTWFTEGSTPQEFRNVGTLADGWLQRYGIDAVVHELNVNRIAGLNDYPSAAHWTLYGRQLPRVLFEYFDTVKL
ncbi:GDSL-type esterase/lipase family protein [Aquisphaera insulae]|uniref:GDSL-type esterase/lipase family protein n=1 Tax=Aquisphaera insulae TaxID=2712864 RepID=UPI00196B351D|nr:GDSL-type esterase/lipase family protein [Aquisphaera insulae]